MSLPCFAIHSLSFFVFSALQQNNEETIGQEFDFPQAGGIHDRSDDRYVMVNLIYIVNAMQGEIVRLFLLMYLMSLLSRYWNKIWQYSSV